MTDTGFKHTKVGYMGMQFAKTELSNRHGIGTGRVLIVDDDAVICGYLASLLRRHGFHVLVAATALEMAHHLECTRIDLVLLDISLPDGDGITILREMRHHTDLPVVMITGNTSEHDRIMALEIGADDYITKPLVPRELLARVRNILRRSKPSARREQSSNPQQLHFANYQLDIKRRSLLLDDEPVMLTAAEFDLLHILLQARGRVLSREYLLSSTRNRDWTPDDRSVDVLIGRIRNKIEPDRNQPGIIKTIRGGGYMIAVPVSENRPQPQLFELPDIIATDRSVRVAPFVIAS
jgi:two-component system, OmpR family, response regulator